MTRAPFDAPRSHDLGLRRRARVTVSITNTTRDTPGDAQVFDVDALLQPVR